MNPNARRLLVAGGIVAALGLVAAGWLAWRVSGVLHPPRSVESAGKLQRDVLGVERVAFEATDGTGLRGWVLDGPDAAPWVVLCHDLASNKGELLGLAVAAQKAGYRVLLFDFRGHGESDGTRSGLGVSEKGDVLGALAYVGDRGGRQVALFGVGMGAHASVLAGVESPEVRVLILDGLVPDATFLLEREVFQGWEFGARHLGFAARAVYGGLNRSSASRERAEAKLPLLRDRSVLLLGSATDAVLAARLESMVETIPVSGDHDGNLVLLPATVGGRLYGEDAERYRARVVEFLLERLPRP